MASGHKPPHALSIARRTAWSAILVVSAGVLNACGGGDGSGSDGQPTPPTVTLTSSAPSVVSGSSVTLTWSSTDTTSCTASGGWSGTKATSGSESIGPLGADATYTLSCSGVGGSTSQSTSVTVTAPVATHFTVTGPTGAVAGTPFNVTVTAFNSTDSVVTSYAGTVHITSTDPQIVRPVDGPLTNGIGTFAVTLQTVGAQTVTATDTVTSITGTSGSIQVSPAETSTPTVNNRLLPTGTVGVAYPGTQFSAINGLEPYVWSETGALPGMELSLDGVLSGTPSSAGRFPITVSVKDALNQTSVPASFTVRVSLARPAASFTPTGSMTIARRGHTATLLESGKVLVAGGRDASAELYDPASGTFTATGSMTVARAGHTATLLSNAALPNHGKVLIVGGDATGTSAELYDPASGTFTTTGSATGVLTGHTATLLNNGRVLIVAGQSTTAAELYDPASGRFTATGNLTFARNGHTATLLLDGQVLIAAGGTNGAELYDPQTGTFTPTGNMNVVRSQATATRLQDGTVLVAGPGATAELYDPAVGTFVLVGEPLSGVDGATASLRKDGTVLIAGGSQWTAFYGSCILPSTECRYGFGRQPYVRLSVALAQSFAPESQGFTATGSLNAARNGHTATVLADGSTVLITGGAQYTASPSYHPTSARHTVLSSAELYK